jgi:hypothetical protein
MSRPSDLIVAGRPAVGVVGDYGGYRGCPREPELRAIAASRGITLPPWGATSEGVQP